MAFFLVLFWPIARGNPPERESDPPIIGRKEPFCGAVGRDKFQVTMQAAPNQMQAGDPLQLTIRIQALGSWQRPPGRPDLVRKPEYAKFRQRFHIDNAGERLNPDQGAWEFDYRLRPKSEKVTAIPSLLVVYFKPGSTPKEKGFMTTVAPGIPLRVSPRARVQPSDLQRSAPSAAVPDRIYHVVDGEKVLRQERPPVLPSSWLLALLPLIPPVFCLGWYRMWRRLHPDGSHLARQRRSRAAQQAMEALAGRAGKPSGMEPFEVGEILAVYLRHRLDFSPLEPTPAEVAHHLEDKGFSADLSARVADFFRACHAARFAPNSPPPLPSPSGGEAKSGRDSFPEAAIGLISRLESEPCLSRIW